MPSPRSGNACNLVAPAGPDAAQDADNADPGVVEKAKAEQQQLGKGKYGTQPTKPFKPGQDDDPDQKPVHWVAIELKTEQGDPVAGEPYQITLPDGRVTSGTLNDKGRARVDGIPEGGTCQITFPKMDKESWSAA
jgi:hypothetical protein